MLDLSKGDWVEARSLVDHWMSVPGTLNVAMLLPWAVASSAWVLAQAGETEEALNRVREGERLLELHAASGIVGHRSWAYQALGRACLLLGRLDEAQRLGYLSVEFAHNQPGFRAHALRLLGDLATHPDQFDAESGEAHYQQALALAELHGMRPLVAHCRFGLGKLYERIGQPEHARENIIAATKLYQDMDMHFWLEAGLRWETLAK
jgi:tetratricopeptide (TPR) repeat protein